MDAVMESMSDAGNCYGNEIVPELSGPMPHPVLRAISERSLYYRRKCYI